MPTRPTAASEQPPLGQNDERSARSWVVRSAVAIAEALFSRGGVPPNADRLGWVEREIGDHLENVGARSRLLLSLLVGVVTVLAPLSIGRLTRLGRLSIADRVRALSTLERALGEPVLAVKAMLCLVYYEHPGAARDVGFDGSCALPAGAAAGSNPGKGGSP